MVGETLYFNLLFKLPSLALTRAVKGGKLNIKCVWIAHENKNVAHKHKQMFRLYQFGRYELNCFVTIKHCDFDAHKLTYAHFMQISKVPIQLDLCVCVHHRQCPTLYVHRNL